MPPRIPPLPADEREDRVEELLRSLRRAPDAPDLNIFATLARHPRLLKRWSAFGGILLYAGDLPARERELLILRTAWNCRAEYEWGQHRAIGLDAGLTEAEVDRVPAGPGAAGWTSGESALLTAADELHDEARISDATWDALAADHTDAQLIEVCMVVGQYHLVAFTLNSLGVEREDGVAPLPS
jgi:4-carboxymuconolactone decarboxylase